MSERISTSIWSYLSMVREYFSSIFRSTPIAPWSDKSWMASSFSRLTILRMSRRQYLSCERFEPRPPLAWKLLPLHTKSSARKMNKTWHDCYSSNRLCWFANQLFSLRHQSRKERSMLLPRHARNSSSRIGVMMHNVDMACNCSSSNCDTVQSRAFRAKSIGLRKESKASMIPLSDRSLTYSNIRLSGYGFLGLRFEYIYILIVEYLLVWMWSFLRQWRQSWRRASSVQSLRSTW